MKKITLGSILHMTKGKKPMAQSRQCEKGYVPYVDIKAFEQGVIENYADPQKCLLCKDGDILIVCDGSRSGFVGKAIPGVVGSTLAIISADGCSNNYLFYFLQSIYTLLNTRQKGTGTPHVNPDILRKSQLVVPPLPEQERIVSRIEELFSRLDAAVAELQTVKEKLNVYRLAVLKDALTPDEHWKKYKFADLMKSVKNGYGIKPSDSGAYNILKISAVRAFRLNFAEVRHNKTPFPEDLLIHENDLLFTRYNGSKELVGGCARVPALSEDFSYPDKIIRCIPKRNSRVHSQFLEYYMNQGEARKYIRSKIKTTSGQNGLSGTDLKKTVVYLPDEKIQQAIVAHIDLKLTEYNEIEKVVEKTLQQASALRQSILKQAFEGNL